jgi:hypothetical protein
MPQNVLDLSNGCIHSRRQKFDKAIEIINNSRLKLEEDFKPA